MRAIATTRCSVVAAIAALLLAGHARTDAQEPKTVKTAPPAQGFEVAFRWDIGSPGKITMAAGTARVFIADTETGVVAYAASDGLLVWQNRLVSSLAPVVAGDTVFVASGGKVYAIDEARGREKWARDLGDNPTALAANGTGVIGAAGQMLRAWSSDGLPVWDKGFAAAIAPGLVAVDADSIYVGLTNRMLVALDAATGAQRWEKRLQTMPRGFSAAGGVVAFGGENKELYAYKRGGGRAWRFRQVDTIGTPAIDEHLIYVALWSNSASAFERGSGKLKWRTDLPARAIRGPWLHGDEVAVALSSGAIVSFDRKTGALRAAPKPDATVRTRDRLLAAVAATGGREVFEVMLLENNSRELVGRRIK